MSNEPKMQTQDFFGDLVRSAQQHPLSAGLVAMGIVWMFSGGGKVSVSETFSRRPFQRAGKSIVDGVGQVGSGIGAAVTNTAAGVGHVAETLTTGAGQLVQGAGSIVSQAASSSVDRLNSMGDGVGRAAHDFSRSAGSLTFSTVDSARRTGTEGGSYIQQQAGEILSRHPTLIGVVGLVVGAGIASAIPITSSEHELMGKHSDALRDQAQSVIAKQTHELSKVTSKLVG